MKSSTVSSIGSVLSSETSLTSEKHMSGSRSNLRGVTRWSELSLSTIVRLDFFCKIGFGAFAIFGAVFGTGFGIFFSTFTFFGAIFTFAFLVTLTALAFFGYTFNTFFLLAALFLPFLRLLFRLVFTFASGMYSSYDKPIRCYELMLSASGSMSKFIISLARADDCDC